jgi:hypothetical protein
MVGSDSLLVVIVLHFFVVVLLFVVVLFFVVVIGMVVWAALCPVFAIPPVQQQDTTTMTALLTVYIDFPANFISWNWRQLRVQGPSVAPTLALTVCWRLCIGRQNKVQAAEISSSAKLHQQQPGLLWA